MDEQRVNENNQENQTQNIESQVDICQKELQHAKDQYKYLTAEFDNYKKRTEKERLSWIQSSQGSVLLDILSVVDDFDRALAQLNSEQITEDVKLHFAGIEMISKTLHKLLCKYDVAELHHHLEFDPELHEAIMHEEAQNCPSGSIVKVLQKGYTHKGQVLRPAKVSVAK